jgi:hypothetical protein
LGAFDSADASTDTRYSFRGQHLDKRVICAPAHGGVEVDYLDFGEGREAAEHFIGAIAFKCLFPTLHQLDDLAVHQINTRNDQ